MKSVTGREIFDAIKKNGWEWVREQYIDYDPTNDIVYGACAIGQAQLNLGINIEHSLQINYSPKQQQPFHPFQHYNNSITSFNDEEVSHTHDNYEDDDYDSETNCTIVYHSYEEIVNYAYEVLAPVFETVFDFEELGFTPKPQLS